TRPRSQPRAQPQGAAEQSQHGRRNRETSHEAPGSRFGSVRGAQNFVAARVVEARSIARSERAAQAGGKPFELAHLARERGIGRELAFEGGALVGRELVEHVGRQARIVAAVGGSVRVRLVGHDAHSFLVPWPLIWRVTSSASGKRSRNARSALWSRKPTFV